MINVFALLTALTVGAYKSELVTDEFSNMYSKVRTNAQEYLQYKGYDGLLENNTVNEVWTQTVNGRNIILRVDDICIFVYDHYGNVTFMNATSCPSSIFDIVTSDLIL